MLIISYDIESDKLRNKFNKYIKQYGYRLQFSVYKIKNSKRILNIIKEEIEFIYKPKFSNSDSVIIFDIDDKNIIRYGYAKNDESDILVID